MINKNRDLDKILEVATDFRQSANALEEFIRDVLWASQDLMGEPQKVPLDKTPQQYAFEILSPKNLPEISKFAEETLNNLKKIIILGEKK